jgi:hypothetical protein
VIVIVIVIHELPGIHPEMVEFARLLGLRFSHDKGCPAERFETLPRTLGDSFECIEIDSSPGNPFGIPLARPFRADRRPR